MSLDDLDYDLCDSCYQSSSDEEKKQYSGYTVDPLAQYVKVIIHKKYIRSFTMHVLAAKIFSHCFN